MTGRVARFAAAVVLAAAAVGCAAPPASVAPTAAPSDVAPVVRAILADGLPAAAADRRLELVRYTIQPGTKLALHRHPGLQLALIESGTLTYTVVEGEVVVHQADGGSRTIAAGSTGTIEPGEWVAEDETVVHFGENAGTEPVVILASSLLEADEPPAITVSPSPVP